MIIYPATPYKDLYSGWEYGQSNDDEMDGREGGLTSYPCRSVILIRLRNVSGN